MNRLRIFEKFSIKQLKEIAKAIHVYFNLATTKRIYELILQVDSIDTALHLLMCHKNTNITLDDITYQFLQGKDEK